MSIVGVVLTPLAPHADSRGVLTEVFRASWPTQVAPVQWNVVSTRANVLRGFHVHVTHADYLTCIVGDLLVGLKDIRPNSFTLGQVDTVLLQEQSPRAISIPPGVAHGFYSAEPSRHLYSVTTYWDAADELGCRWDDPDIGIAWPATAPELSARDQEAGSFAKMVESFVSAEREQARH